MSEHWFEGVGLAESPFAEAESAVTDEVEALAGAWPAEAVGLPPSWPEDEEYEQPTSGEDPLGLQRMLQLPGRFDDPKRDPAIDKDGTRFDLFLGGRSRRDFASSWLAQRPGLAEAAREPMADLTAGDIAKAWFVIHDVGVKSSLSDRRFKAADKATKKGSVHGFLNRSGYYAATHDFSKDRKGTVYEFLSRKGKKIAGGKTINIETVPDIENGVADRADGSHGTPSNADRYASIGYRKAGAKKVNYYKWTNAAFDILADLYILASARAGHLLTITAHKEMDRNLGRSVIWREYLAAEIRQAAKKFLKKARDNPSDYHGDPFAFDVQALYDVITRKLNALGGAQMPPGARYGVHPLRLRTAGGADVGNGDGQLHEFPHQSDPRVKTDTKLKKPGWWAQGSKSEAEGFAGEDEEDGFGEDPGAAFEDSHAFEGEETEIGLGGEAMAEADRPEPEAATPWSEGAFEEYLDENGLTPGPISSYSESIGDFAREAGYEAVVQARAFLGGSIWTYASRACGSRVSVFVPAAAQGREKVDLMLYVHGLLGPCGAPRVMPEGLVSAAPFALGKIVAESARPMILVVPRFQPGNDKSWSPHRLDRPGAINALFAEVLAETGRRLNRAAPAIDQLIVAGHSRAWGILYPLARASASPELGKGALARLSRIWALDATYGTPPMAAFESLTKAKQGLGVEIVYRAKSLTDKFKGASRAGALALRPIPRSITHCAVPGRMLPALLAELPPPRPEALDAGSEAEDLWAETPGSGWSESGVTETEWLESEWESDEAEAEEEALDEESVESQELFEAEEFARHALYEVSLDEDEIELGFAAEESPAEAPSSRPRNLTSSQVRKAWRAYAGAKHRMVPLRLFGRWNPPVNPLTVDAWRALERALGASNYDVHRAWVFVDRSIAGTQTHSLHAYGLAIDIDHAKPTCNVNRATPNHRKVRFSSAATKEGRCQDVRDRKADTSFTRDQVAAVEAIRTVDGHQVFVWGGRWQNIKDTMHFEINVTPDELARGLQPAPGHRLQLADPAGEFEEEYLEVDAGMPDVSLGTLTFSAPGWKAFTYRFTAEDLVWAARFMAGEAGGVDNLENRAVLWLMFNRYAYFRHEHQSWGTFGDFIRRYSTPLQPYLYSLGAAKRHWRKCNSSYTNCDYVPMAERYGYYKGTQIPRGQLRQFIKLQQRPWSKLPASARDLALRALQGAIPNLIGTASEFDDTATYYKDDNGERPTRQQWLDYTKNFAAKKRYLWPSHSQPYDQYGHNVIFIHGRARNLEEGARIVPPGSASEAAGANAGEAPATTGLVGSEAWWEAADDE
jgi:hypothetical protein